MFAKWTNIAPTACFDVSKNLQKQVYRYDKPFLKYWKYTQTAYSVPLDWLQTEQKLIHCPGCHRDFKSFSKCNVRRRGIEQLGSSFASVFPLFIIAGLACTAVVSVSFILSSARETRCVRKAKGVKNQRKYPWLLALSDSPVLYLSSLVYISVSLLQNY